MSSCFVFGQNRPRTVCGDVLDRKQAFPGYKNVDFTWSSHWIFPKGLIHDFGQKFEFFLVVSLGQNRVSNSVW